MKRLLLAALVIVAAVAAYTVLRSQQDDASSCGRVTVANMNWDSATLLAHVDKYILENGYGCTVELVPGDTQPTGTSMTEKGEPDIAPEQWTNSFKVAIEQGVTEGRLKVAGASLSDGGVEGFFVPKFLVDEYPEVATIDGVKAHPELFPHPEDADKGALYGCPAGWACEISSRHLFTALGLEEAGFELVDPGSSAGLAGTIAQANERTEGWFGYYWSPTPILGQYEMVRVDFGTGVDEQHWVDCITQEDCQDPHPTMHPVAPVRTITTAGFAERAPDAYAYLEQRSFTNADMNSLLAWMADNQADGEIGAEHFLKNFENMWSAWIPAEIAAKIKEVLTQ